MNVNNPSLKNFPMPSLFSFKEKNQQEMNNIMSSLNKKLFSTNPSSKGVDKVNNLVTDNFNNLINNANNNGFGINRDGFRKKRFQKIIDQLK